MQKGFIRDKLQLKLMLLYILDRVLWPIDLSSLTELALCDDGVDYFSFTEALSELTESGHVTLEHDRYTITSRGREQCRVWDSEIPPSVRTRCEHNAEAMNHRFSINGQKEDLG